MRSLISRLLIGLTTFASSLLLVWLLHVYFNRASDSNPQISSYISSNKAEDYAKTFSASCSCQDYSTPGAANWAFQGRLRTNEFKCYNSGIIERGVKLNEQGQRVGKRVVANIGCGEEGQQFTSIFWTEGSKFCEIQALNIYGALNYEKVRKP